MIVLLPADGDEALPESFIWLTLRQIATLLRQHNLVHATTRSILASLFCCCTSPGLKAAAGRAGKAPEAAASETFRGDS